MTRDETEGPSRDARGAGAGGPPGPAVLYVPAGSPRALGRLATLDADALILDLEDAVAPGAKAEAREALRETVRAGRPSRPFAVRVNGLGTPHFAEDLLAARAILPDAIVVPKVGSPDDLAAVALALDETDAPPSLRLWAMIETPRGILAADAIAASGGRLAALVAGTNDLVAATGVSVAAGRRHLHPWLMTIVLAARAHGLVALDGVCNVWDDPALGAEATEGATMGFDGKTLIHPAQVAPTRAAFAPGADELASARAVVAAFAGVGDEVGVLTVDGRMVERLHLHAAHRTLARAGRAVEASAE